MKEMMKQVQSFLTFDAPLDFGNISTQFASTHNRQQKVIYGWGTNSTRKQLIAAFWFTYVLRHFISVLGLSVLIVLLLTSSFNISFLFVTPAVGLLSFFVLLFFHYLPGFVSNFLPKLEAIATSYENRQKHKVIKHLQQQLKRQQEQEAEKQIQFQQQLTEQLEKGQKYFQEQITDKKLLVEQQQEEIKKCRQAQLSNLALTLVYYTLAKLAGINKIEGNDQTANLLLKLFGVDRGSLRTNLELIAGTGGKRKNLTERRRTEIRNRFEEAIQFFEEVHSLKGIQLLKELETKVLGN